MERQSEEQSARQIDLEGQLRGANRQLGNLVEVEGANMRLETTVQEVIDEKRLLQDRVAELQSQLEAAQASAKEIASQLEVARSASADLKIALDATKQTVAQQTADEERLKSGLKNAKANVEAQKVEIESLKQQIVDVTKSTQEEVKQLKEKLKTANLRLFRVAARSTQKIEKVEGEKRQLEANIKELEARIKELETQVDALETEVRNLRQQQTEKETDLTTLRELVPDLKNQLLEKDKVVQSQFKKITEMKRAGASPEEIEAAEQANDDLEHEVLETGDLIDKKKAQEKLLEADLDQLQFKMASKEDELAKSEQDLVRTKEEVAQAQATIQKILLEVTQQSDELKEEVGIPMSEIKTMDANQMDAAFYGQRLLSKDGTWEWQSMESINGEAVSSEDVPNTTLVYSFVFKGHVMKLKDPAARQRDILDRLTSIDALLESMVRSDGDATDANNQIIANVTAIREDTRTYVKDWAAEKIREAKKSPVQDAQQIEKLTDLSRALGRIMV